MNKIVRQHYPVERLPEDLRAALGLARTVTVTIEPEGRPGTSDSEVQRALDAFRTHRARLPITDSDSVERISKLRDEWDR